MSEQERDPLIFLRVRLDSPQSGRALLDINIPFLRQDFDGIEDAKGRLMNLAEEIFHEQMNLRPKKQKEARALLKEVAAYQFSQADMDFTITEWQEKIRAFLGKEAAGE